MELKEFEKQLNVMRARNGWIIELELAGPWIISVFDKETRKMIAQTGTTGLETILNILDMPFDKPPWK